MRRIIALAVALLVLAVSGARSAQDDELVPARRFNSDLVLQVVVVLPSAEINEECIAGVTRVLGRTPSIDGLEIPACVTWYVEPTSADIDDAWLTAVAKECRKQQIPGISVRGCYSLTDRSMGALAGSKTLTYLDVRNTSITSSGLQKLKTMKALRYLDVRGASFKGCEFAKKLTALEVLDLSENRALSGSELSSLTKSKSLRELRMRSMVFLLDAGLEHVAKVKGLERLDLTASRQLTAEGVERLAGLRRLRELRLDLIPITDDTLETLGSLESLTTLSVLGCQELTDAGLVHLAELPRLRRLNVGFLTKLTDAGLATIGELSQLEEVVISGSRNVTPTGIAHVAKLPELQVLELSMWEGYGEALHVLADCSKLRVLDLHTTGTSDAGLVHIGALTGLRELDLSRCGQVGSAGLTALAPLVELTTLDLTGVAAVGDEAVPHLAKLTSLRTLQLEKTSITAEGEAELARALPECVITR